MKNKLRKSTYITRKRKARRRQRHLVIFLSAIVMIALIGIALVMINRGKAASGRQADAKRGTKEMDHRPEFSVQLLEYNAYSRPGKALEQVNGIVVHYTANPGTTAQQNRDYFAGLAQAKTTYASSHFVIGLEGEVIQCIPCNEWAYASNDRNRDTIAIECCIPDETGKFNEQTYDALVELVSWLMVRYDLSTDAVIRHYDVTGKLCPKYFVEHPLQWDQFKTDLETYIQEHSTESTQSADS